MATNLKNNLIILFTRAPERGSGKTRLSGFLSEEERYELSLKLITDNLSVLNACKCDYVIYYSGNQSNLDFSLGSKKNQIGSGLGEKMLNAFDAELVKYNKVILFGSDVYNLDSEKIAKAFLELELNDIVISPALDGGYGLIGMKTPYDIFTGVEYSNKQVLKNTLNKIKSKNLTFALLDEVDDIDNFSDILRAEFSPNKMYCIGSGEYNLNYLIDDKIVRVNLASQLGLGAKQIPYEYGALKILEKTKITPKVFDCKDSGKYLPRPYLFMEFLEGCALNYDKDLTRAAKSLATIHGLRLTKTEKNHFIKADRPFLAMYKESLDMYAVYKNWADRDNKVCVFLERYFLMAEKLNLEAKIENESIINTELNNRNFIVNDEKVYIIDWEKPIIGEAEQDLAHFMVPTTTNWKTDKILNPKERKLFIDAYRKFAPIDEQKLYQYEVFNCLRGLTWCAMALVEYSSDRGIKNKDTFSKIKYFMSDEFFDVVLSYLNIKEL